LPPDVNKHPWTSMDSFITNTSIFIGLKGCLGTSLDLNVVEVAGVEHKYQDIEI